MNQYTWKYSTVLPSLYLLLITLVLTGCGGGGGNNPPPPDALTLNLSPQAIKTFHFSWSDVDGETEYRLLENPDGISGYGQVASIAADVTSYDLIVSLPERINASYILQACDAAGCTDSPEVFVTGSLEAAIGYLKASNTGTVDHFGLSVALAADGNTLAIVATSEDSAATGINGNQADDTMANSGAAYVFGRDGSGIWTQQAYIKASNTGANDSFGSSVALSADGNTLAVGAILEDSAATGIDGDQSNDTATDAGAVYVYSRSGANWTQQAYVKASNTEAEDGFGISVALAADGNTLAVGAYREDSAATGIGGNQGDNTALSAGAVYVYSRSVATWTQQAYLKTSNAGAGDTFGLSLALAADGNTLAAGAHFEDSAATGIDGNQTDNNASGAGAAYVFTRDGTGTWTQQAYIKASNTGADDYFGYSLALAADGDTLAVGAYGEDSAATGVDGDQTSDTASSAGAVYVFSRNGAGSWSQRTYLKASNTGADDYFGRFVALAGDSNTLAVGAYGEDSAASGIDGDQTSDTASSAGAVYLFGHDGMGNWGQQAYLKAPNTGSGDSFGGSIALTSDGSTLAVGAVNEDSAATGIGGDQADDTATNAGAAYLY